MAINQADWNIVRDFLAGGEQLYRRVEGTRTVFSEEDGQEVSMSYISYEPVEVDGGVKASFARIEQDVERIVQEVQSLQIAERELRTALEEPATSEFQRR